MDGESALSMSGQDLHRDSGPPPSRMSVPSVSATTLTDSSFSCLRAYFIPCLIHVHTSTHTLFLQSQRMSKVYSNNYIIRLNGVSTSENWHMWRHLWKSGWRRAKKNMLWSDATQTARRLSRACTFCHIMGICRKHFFLLSAQIKNTRWIWIRIWKRQI